MEELLAKINEQLTDFAVNSKDNFEKGNKKAGVRARKTTLQLERLFKEYRQRSIECDQQVEC